MRVIPEYKEKLPVVAVGDDIVKSLKDNNRLIVTAPPGSGKSTLIPLLIAEAFEEGKIIMLEPRRAAARQIAMRMTAMTGQNIGESIGYRMRFESNVSADTRIEVVTEGIMERILIDNPTLDGVAAVIFDEFHERSLTADLTLAMTLEAQNQLRPDLRVVLMSATIETDALSNLLNAPVIGAEGKMFDVSVINGEDFDPRDCVPAIVSAVRRAYREQEGNILAFLPGQGEIVASLRELERHIPEAIILPLYGMLTSAEQYRALEYNPAGQRKIVLATPIAETSLTIEGVSAVVDSGLYRTVRYDPSTGLGRMETAGISLDMARQRSGRAGRLSNGVCYRLWSKAAELRMKPNRTPEILTSDLSGMLLDIAAWNGIYSDNLPWIDTPPAAHIAEAHRLLRTLGAIDSTGAITPRGRRMAAIPSHPRISSMLVNAGVDKRKALAADLAALLEVKDPMQNDTDADINTRIEELRHRRSLRNAGGWKQIMRIAAQYRRMLRCSEDNSPVDQYDTGALLAMAYPERVAMRLHDNVYRLPGGENVTLNEQDNLTACDFIAVAAMGQRVFLASPLSGETLAEMSVEYDNISWNSREGRLVARRELRVGVLVIGSKAINSPDHDRVVQVIANAAVKDGLSTFDFNDAASGLQRRIATVAAWHPEMGLPDVSTERLLATAPEWLPLYIGGATTRQELSKIDLCEVIRGIVGYELMQEIDRLAPSHIRLPGGRCVRIDYRAASSAPVVSARISDCLGLCETPRIDGGRRPVLMELLSPGFKPVQLTADLHSFWTTTYFEIRKELRRRYPKHRWPDNPLDCQATDK